MNEPIGKVRDSSVVAGPEQPFVQPDSNPASAKINTVIKESPFEFTLQQNNKSLGILPTVEVISRLTRLTRSILRIAGVMSQNTAMLSVVQEFALLRIIDLYASIASLTSQTSLFLSKGLSKEQRTAALLNIMKRLSDIISDLDLVLSAIIRITARTSANAAQWLASNPHIAKFISAGIYFALASTASAITKNIIDLVFTSDFIKDLEPLDENRDYMQLRKEWDEKIEKYHWTLNKLFKICEPECMKVLRDFEDEVKKHSRLDDCEKKQHEMTFDKKTNKELGKILLGRITFKHNTKWDELTSNTADFAALTMMTVVSVGAVTAPPLAAAGMAVASGLMVATSVSWINIAIKDAESKIDVTNKISRLFRDSMGLNSVSSPQTGRVAVRDH